MLARGIYECRSSSKSRYATTHQKGKESYAASQNSTGVASGGIPKGRQGKHTGMPCEATRVAPWVHFEILAVGQSY